MATTDALRSQVLRRPAVEELTGLARSTIYAMLLRGEFPEPIKIGRQAVAWRRSDIERWLAARPEVTRRVRLQKQPALRLDHAVLDEA